MLIHLKSERLVIDSYTLLIATLLNYRWLYMLTLAMDANFRLRSKVRGIKSDPHLSPGWAYFVDPTPYGSFVADYADDDDVSWLVLLIYMV